MNVYLDEMPYPAGRYVFNKKEILKKILAAIEQWYYSSNTPQNKRIVVTGSGIARHVCFGTFKYSLNPDEQTYFRKVRTNVFRWLNVFATERAGNNTWQFTLEAIDNLKKEIELTPEETEKKETKTRQYYKQYRENNKEKIKQYNDQYRSKKKTNHSGGITLNKYLDEILDEIRLERKRQDEKWGEQNHNPINWVVILTEEVGETAKEALEDNKRKYRKELVQCGAVCVAAIESLDRNEKQ